MKKFLTLLILILSLSLVLVGCGNNTPNEPDPQPDQSMNIAVYMPDGAPALAMAQLLKDNMQFDNNVKYEVVDAKTIATKITGANPVADVALVPVNLASLKLGAGDMYKLATVNTQGNLYMLSKNSTPITNDNINTLKGKTIAVVNLPNVPGLTFQAVLTKANIEFTTDENAKTENNVLLKNIAGTEIGPSLNNPTNPCDYVVAPEPAISAVTAKVPVIKNVAALHTLYGGFYPQAVLVVKKTLAEQNMKFVNEFISALEQNVTYLKNAPATEVVDAISSKLTEGLTPSFSSKNLTASVIANCNIMVTKNADAKTMVNNYINDLIAINPQSCKALSDNFFLTVD